MVLLLWTYIVRMAVVIPVGSRGVNSKKSALSAPTCFSLVTNARHYRQSVCATEQGWAIRSFVFAVFTTASQSRLGVLIVWMRLRRSMRGAMARTDDRTVVDNSVQKRTAAAVDGHRLNFRPDIVQEKQHLRDTEALTCSLIRCPITLTTTCERCTSQGYRY